VANAKQISEQIEELWHTRSTFKGLVASIFLLNSVFAASTLTQLASRSSSFTLSRAGPPTGDLHPIYNAPMLGVHKMPGAYSSLRAEMLRHDVGSTTQHRKDLAPDSTS